MKRIINGKKYDTSTAALVCERSYGNPRDFDWFEERLYRKSTGEFFLHGAGGAMTGYARAVGQNERSGGEQITPYSEDEARAFAEENMDADEYEQVFGEVAE